MGDEAQPEPVADAGGVVERLRAELADAERWGANAVGVDAADLRSLLAQAESLEAARDEIRRRTAERMAAVLHGMLRRGEIIGADAIECAATLAGPSPPITDEDREWARRACELPEVRAGMPEEQS
jgi:hypothetical protein